jgi:hypothetical protein
MKGKDWGILIAVVVVVAILVSFVTTQITGNVISVAKGSAGKVYTTTDIDAKLNSISVGSLLKKNCRLISQYGTAGVKSESGTMCADREFAIYGGGVCYKSVGGKVIPNSHPFGYMTDGPLGGGITSSNTTQGWATQCQSPSDSILVIAQTNAFCCK